MKTKNRRIRPGALLLALAVLTTIAAGFWGAKPLLEGQDVRVATHGIERVLPRVAWPEGERRIYRLSYSSRDEVRPLVDDLAAAAGEPMRSEIQLGATVAVTGLGEGAPEGSTRVVFEVLSCEEASWSVESVPVWPDVMACAEMLLGQRMAADLSPQGATLAVYDPPDAESAVQSLLQTLWLELQLSLPAEPVAEGGRWFAQERDMQGMAARSYRLDSSDAPRIERRTEAYFEVRLAEGLRQPPTVDASGDASYSIDPDGRLRQAEGKDLLFVQTASGHSILQADASFALDWLRDEPASAIDLAGWLGRGPASIAASANTRAELLDQQIGDLDVPKMLGTLRSPRFRPGSRDEGHFIWQATGLLERDPKASWKLLAMARGENASKEQQARALDLLSSVGHDEAQAVMRDALKGIAQSTGQDGHARMLYQRLSLLDEPNAETARFVAEDYAALRGSGDIEAELTTAYSLGAIVEQLARGDETARELASEYNALLVDDLRSSSDPDAIAHRVSAVGNARLAENVPLLSDLATHQHGMVRERVAHALGKVEGDAPPAALVELIGDADQMVQRVAVRSAKPHDAVYDRLAAEAMTGPIEPLNVRPVLDLVKAGRQSHRTETTRILEAMIDQGIADDKDRAVAYRLLEI